MLEGGGGISHVRKDIYFFSLSVHFRMGKRGFFWGGAGNIRIRKLETFEYLCPDFFFSSQDRQAFCARQDSFLYKLCKLKQKGLTTDWQTREMRGKSIFKWKMDAVKNKIKNCYIFFTKLPKKILTTTHQLVIFNLFLTVFSSVVYILSQVQNKKKFLHVLHQPISNPIKHKPPWLRHVCTREGEMIVALL